MQSLIIVISILLTGLSLLVFHLFKRISELEDDHVSRERLIYINDEIENKFQNLSRYTDYLSNSLNLFITYVENECSPNIGYGKFFANREDPNYEPEFIQIKSKNIDDIKIVIGEIPETEADIKTPAKRGRKKKPQIEFIEPKKSA